MEVLETGAPPLPSVQNDDAIPPPPPPPEGEKCPAPSLSESPPVSYHLSPRGLKRADVDDDVGENTEQPMAKVARITEPSEHVDLHVIDDIAGSDDEGDAPANDSDDSDWAEDDIDALLDEGVKDYKQKKEEMAKPIEKAKVVLIEKGNDPFEVLPDGWLCLTHNSGMPLYLHKASRVCTLSRPYFLGSGSARKHDIPLSSIPCLQYKKALEKEQKSATDPSADPTTNGSVETNGENQTESKTPNEIPSTEKLENGPAENMISDTQSKKSDDTGANNTAEKQQKDTADNQEKDTTAETGTTPAVITAEDYVKENSLAPSDVQDYCQSLFKFKTITVKRFRT